MSYCRWGRDSSCYIYSTEKNEIVCCGCNLSKNEKHSNYVTYSRIKMLEHIKEHEREGGEIPEYAKDRIRREINLIEWAR